MTFTQAREKLGNRDSKKVANNTYLMARRTPEGEYYIALRLHETDIIEFYENDEMAVFTGGWQTVTTKARINEYLPCNGVFQKHGDWFWNILGSEPEAFSEGDIVMPVGNGLFRVMNTRREVKGNL